MTPLPAALLDGLHDARRVEAWWSALADQDQSELSALFDDRNETQFFGVVLDDPSAPVPRVIGGKFLPHDDAWGLSEWGPGYFEYILEHPERFPSAEPHFRSFYIAGILLLASGVPICQGVD